MPSVDTIPFLNLCIREVLWDSVLKNQLTKISAPAKFISEDGVHPRREVSVHCKLGTKLSLRTLSKVELSVFADPFVPNTPTRKITCSLVPKDESDMHDLTIIVDLNRDDSSPIEFDVINADNLDNPQEREKAVYLQEIAQAVLDISEGKLKCLP